MTTTIEVPAMAYDSSDAECLRQGGPSWVARLEHSVSIAVLAVTSLLPLVEIAARALAGRGVAGSIPIVQHLTLWIAFLGAALAAGSDRLLALSTANFLPDRWRRSARIFTFALAAGIAASLLLASLALVRTEFQEGAIVALGIPVWVAMLVMPAGFALTAGRLVWRAAEDGPGRLLASLGLAVPLLGLFPALQGGRILMPAGLVLIAATALGMPVFAALGGATLLLFWSEGAPVAAVPDDIYKLASEPLLAAIPLFTLGGFILAESGAGQRLLRAFTSLVGWVPGGLAIVVTLVLAFFTPLTGASGITILSLGGLMLPMLTLARYPKKTAMGLVTVSGSIGLLIPPSLPIILYAIYAQVSMKDLFIGALVPGTLLILMVAGWGAFQGWKAGAPRTPFRAREAADALWQARWELLLPILILAGYFGGWMTLVETAAFTVLYAVLTLCVLRKDLSVRRDLPRVAVESATLLGGFLIILGAALAFTNYLVYAEVPMLALGWVRSHIESPLVFLLALNLLLLIVGALMDIYSAILVVVPLAAPMAAIYGIDPVHMGIIFLANMELGYLMPPMGENLFLAAFRFKQPLGQICLATAPFMLLLLAAVLLITYVPALTLGLVRLTGG